MLTPLMLGLAVGLILALTEAGGGILAVPLLVLGAHIGVAQAGPLGLMAVGMAAALGAILGLRAGVVRYRAVLLIAVTGMLLSPAGLWLARRIDNRWLSVLFAMVLLYVAFNTACKARGGNDPQRLTRHENQYAYAGPIPAALSEAAPAPGRSRCPAPLPACCPACWARAAGLRDGAVVAALYRPCDAVRGGDLPGRNRADLDGRRCHQPASGALTWRIALPFSVGALAGAGRPYVVGAAVRPHSPNRMCRGIRCRCGRIIAKADDDAHEQRDHESRQQHDPMARDLVDHAMLDRTVQVHLVEKTAADQPVTALVLIAVLVAAAFLTSTPRI